VQAGRSAEPAGTLDAVIFGPVRRHPAATSRIIENTYPDAFAGMKDLTLKTLAADTDGLWDKNRSIASALERVGDADVVWLVTSNKQDRRPVVTAGLEAQGFHIDGEWQLSRTNVVRYER
jgi:mannosyltransferase